VNNDTDAKTNRRRRRSARPSKVGWVSLALLLGMALLQSTNNNAQGSALADLKAELTRVNEELISEKVKSKEAALELKKQALIIINLQREKMQIMSQLSDSYDTSEELITYLENMPGCVWLKMLPDYRYKMINPAYARAFGTTRGRFEGRTDYDLYPASLADEYRLNDEHVTATRRPVVTLEWVPRRAHEPEGPDNKVRQWLIMKFPLIRAGLVIGVGGVAFPTGGVWSASEIENLRVRLGAGRGVETPHKHKSEHIDISPW
jgi:PAS domain-containing protein